MKRLILALLLILSSAAAVAAQSSTTSLIVWDYQGIPGATAQNYGHAVTIDGVAQPSSATCTGTTSARCQQVVPTITPTSHQVVVTALIAGVERSISTTVDVSKGPVQMTGARVVITTVVTFP